MCIWWEAEIPEHWLETRAGKAAAPSQPGSLGHRAGESQPSFPLPSHVLCRESQSLLFSPIAHTLLELLIYSGPDSTQREHQMPKTESLPSEIRPLQEPSNSYHRSPPVKEKLSKTDENSCTETVIGVSPTKVKSWKFLKWPITNIQFVF